MKTVIFGNGSMAKVLYSYLRQSKPVSGFTVDDQCMEEHADTFCHLPLVPFSRAEKHFDPSTYEMIIAIGYLEMNQLRSRKYDEAREKGYSFTRYIHPSVFIHDEVIIDHNCIILDHVSIHPGCRIGQGTFISSQVSIGHDCIIDSLNWINSGVSIAGGCRIGTGSFFGVNACVGHNVQVGARNYIAANTLINKDTKNDEVFISEPGQLFPMNSKSFLKFSPTS